LYYNLGVLLQRLNRLSDAQRQYCLAQESFEQQVTDFEQRSAAVRGDQEGPRDDDTVNRLALRQLAANINLADVHNSLGSVFLARGKQESARREFDAALGKFGDLAPANYNLAILLRKKSPAEALGKMAGIH